MKRYAWAAWGDVNAFFGLMLDNVAVMVLFVSLIAGGATGQYTRQFVLTHMIPGTALGVLLGDLVYTGMAFRLSRRTGKRDVTAMPLGLDTPSTFGVAFLVMLPALAEGNKLFPADHDRAMLYGWHVGLAVLVLIGLFKVACAPLGNAVRRWVPRAGLLGSLAAIALALIAFVPLLLNIASVPVVGFVVLTVILITLVAHRALPYKVPGALAAVVLGMVLVFGGRALGHLAGTPLVPAAPPGPEGTGLSLPSLSPFTTLEWDWWRNVLVAALAKLPVALPFALATIVGGIDCTESAAAAGDEYDTRTVLLTEGVASVAAGLLGGVIQTTPYIGHPAYKAMGGRAAYTLATALFVGAVGCFGLFGLLFEFLPPAAMFPILVFVGLEITAQSFHATPVRHYPALAFAFLPTLAYLALIPLNDVLGQRAPASERGEVVLTTLRCLANGFIVTSLLWAAALAALMDGRLRQSAAYLLFAGFCALFGVIHSPLPGSPIAWPWEVFALLPDRPELRCQSPYHWAAAYALSAAVLVGLSFLRAGRDGRAAPSPDIGTPVYTGEGRPLGSTSEAGYGDQEGISMFVRGRWFSVLPVLLSFALSAGAAVPPKPDPADVDAAVREALKAWGVPGASVAVVRDGEVVYLKGHGLREAGTDWPVTPDTVFPLASCTKAFTTTVMAMLVDEGKMSWDDPVRKHLDWFHLSDPLADRDVTLRDLVTHRTGLRGHEMLWYRSPARQEEIVRRMALLPLDRPFRTTFQYQSTMFTAAGLAAGSAAKSTWADLVRTRLLVPLEMTGASLTTTEAEKSPDRAMPHRPGRDGRPDAIAWYPQETPDPAGSVNASARDLTKWLTFQLGEGRYKGKRLVGAAALRETHAAQIVLPLDAANNPETNLSSYGMAWRIQDYRGRLMLSHAGAIDGFRAQIILLPKEGVGIALLCNLHQSRINLALGNTLVDLFLGVPKKDWNGYFLGVVKKEDAARRERFVKRWGERDPNTKPSLPIGAYEGVYEHPAYGKARVSAEGGCLVLRWGSFKWPLLPYHDDTFTVREDFFGETAVRFSVGDKASVTALRIAEPLDVEFKKK